MQVEHFEDLAGKRLLHGVTDSKGLMLVPDGTLLMDEHVEKLRKFNIDIFDIHVEDVEKKKPAASPKPASAPEPPRSRGLEFVPLETHELLMRSEMHMKEISLFVARNGRIPVTDIEQKVMPFIMEVAAKKISLFQLFAELRKKGDYRYKQSVGVAVIATLLGSWLHLDEQEMTLLSTAASIYDIGSVKLPNFLLDKTSWYQPHEFEIMKTHTTMGYELIQEAEMDHRVALAALEHHERADGSGYPHGLKGTEMDRISRIVALADVYLAMISERPYRPSIPFYQVIQELHGLVVKNKFDSTIGMTFLNRLMASQVGSEVILSDERKGKILLINANYPTSPLISLGNEFIDLSKTSSVRIKEVIG
jgi:HD-GYP domain-containing protein (c-di-GMP phosphodiesterase class II)